MHTHHHMLSAESFEELKALVEYTLNHNTAHTEELLQIAQQLKAQEKNAASEKVLEALGEYKKGNELMEEALKLMK